MTTAPDPPAGVDLTQEADFRLGAMEVSPSTARVRSAAGEQRVEPRVMEVLVVLVRAGGRTVSRDQLIDACWGGRAVSDDAVTRVVAQVRALGRSLDPPPFTLETLPKLGFRLIAADAAEPPLAVQSPNAAPTPPSVGRRRAWIAPIAAVGLLALATGVVWWLSAQPTRAPGQNGRIDVMAFQAQGADPTLPKIADDLSQSIVRVLAGAGAQVAERPLARDSAGSDAELRVAGTVEREQDNYVFNPQILDRRSGLVLWGDRLVQTPQKQKSAPGDVADTIAAVLHCALEDRKLSRAPISTEAFGLYLNACAGVFVDGDRSGRMLAVTRRLVKAEPKFAAAQAMHSIAAANAAWDAANSPSEAAALHAESKAAAEAALKLDPNTPKAYSGLALNEGALSGGPVHNWYLVEQYTRRGLRIDPDLPPARNEYATMLRSVGRTKEAAEFLKGGDIKDPRAGGDPRVAMLLGATGDLEGAENQVNALETATRTSYDSIRWVIAFWWRDPRTALQKLDTLKLNMSPDDRNCYRAFLTQLDTGKAKSVHGLPKPCDGVQLDWKIRMMAREGDVDGAFAGLGGRVAAGSMILFYPEMGSVRRDLRFWPVAQRFGLVDYWLKSGHWPDFCAEPGLPYDCRKMAAATAAASGPARTAGR